MGTDIVLEVTNQLLAMLNVLDDEENAHREREQSNEANADFKSKALVKFRRSHVRPDSALQPCQLTGAQACFQRRGGRRH